MRPLKDYSQAALLNIWAHSANNAQVVTTLSSYGVKASTREVGHRIWWMLKRRNLLPARPVTPADYTRIKEKLIEEWRMEELV